MGAGTSAGNAYSVASGPSDGVGETAGRTKTEAEAELRRMRLATEETPPPETTVTVDEAAGHLMRHLERPN